MQIARDIAKGRMPAFSGGLDRYFVSSPHEIFAAFAGVARHMPPAGKDEGLAIAYLFLLSGLLEHLRYRIDSGYADAAKLVEDFQAEVAARAQAGEVSAPVIALVGRALHQAKIPASRAFAAASVGDVADQGAGDLAALKPAAIRLALGEAFEAFGDDPFIAVGALLESTYALPADGRAALAGELALSGNPAARSAAVLVLLDPDATVRRAVAGMLGQVASSLSPVDVRRLIAMRNWRPENERAGVDAVIRKARAAGAGCAQWEEGSIETLAATAIDGVMAQGFLLISPAARRKKRFSSILTKGGIADAYSNEPKSRQALEAQLAATQMDASLIAVSRAYLDRAIAHHLALTTEKGEAPPAGLLQVAETIGGADWQPARMDVRETLAGLIAEVPQAMRQPAALASLLRNSGGLADLMTIAKSWYEDDPQVAKAVASAGGRRAKIAAYLLQTVIARQREKWAEIFLRTALWMRAASPAPISCWRDLALVAKALMDGQDMTEIGLMQDIALRTIAALRDAGRA